MSLRHLKSAFANLEPFNRTDITTFNSSHDDFQHLPGFGPGIDNDSDVGQSAFENMSEDQYRTHGWDAFGPIGGPVDFIPNINAPGFTNFQSDSLYIIDSGQYHIGGNNGSGVVDYIDNTHANGFTPFIQTTQFTSVSDDNSVTVGAGSLYGIGGGNGGGVVDYMDNIHAPGFTTYGSSAPGPGNPSPGWDTTLFTNFDTIGAGSLYGIGGGLGTGVTNYFGDPAFLTNFESQSQTQMLGVTYVDGIDDLWEPTTSAYGIGGALGIGTVDGWINTHATGFTQYTNPTTIPGTTDFQGITVVAGGTDTYVNPGSLSSLSQPDVWGPPPFKKNFDTLEETQMIGVTYSDTGEPPYSWDVNASAPEGQYTGGEILKNAAAQQVDYMGGTNSYHLALAPSFISGFDSHFNKSTDGIHFYVSNAVNTDTEGNVGGNLLPQNYGALSTEVTTGANYNASTMGSAFTVPQTAWGSTFIPNWNFNFEVVPPAEGSPPDTLPTIVDTTRLAPTTDITHMRSSYGIPSLNYTPTSPIGLFVGTDVLGEPTQQFQTIGVTGGGESGDVNTGYDWRTPHDPTATVYGGLFMNVNPYKGSKFDDPVNTALPQGMGGVKNHSGLPSGDGRYFTSGPNPYPLGYSFVKILNDGIVRQGGRIFSEGNIETLTGFSNKKTYYDRWAAGSFTDEGNPVSSTYFGTDTSYLSDDGSISLYGGASWYVGGQNVLNTPIPNVNGFSIPHAYDAETQTGMRSIGSLTSYNKQVSDEDTSLVVTAIQSSQLTYLDSTGAQKATDLSRDTLYNLQLPHLQPFSGKKDGNGTSGGGTLNAGYETFFGTPPSDILSQIPMAEGEGGGAILNWVGQFNTEDFTTVYWDNRTPKIVFPGDTSEWHTIRNQNSYMGTRFTKKGREGDDNASEFYGGVFNHTGLLFNHNSASTPYSNSFRIINKGNRADIAGVTGDDIFTASGEGHSGLDSIKPTADLTEYGNMSPYPSITTDGTSIDAGTGYSRAKTAITTLYAYLNNVQSERYIQAQQTTEDGGQHGNPNEGNINNNTWLYKGASHLPILDANASLLDSVTFQGAPIGVGNTATGHRTVNVNLGDITGETLADMDQFNKLYTATDEIQKSTGTAYYSNLRTDNLNIRFVSWTGTRGTDFSRASGGAEPTYGGASREPYVLSPIPTSSDDQPYLRTASRLNQARALEQDFQRVADFMTSDKGVEHLTKQNALGLAAYLNQIIGGGADRGWGSIFALGVGAQRFNYLDTTLGLYAPYGGSSMGGIKPRLAKSWPLTSFLTGKYQAPLNTGLLNANRSVDGEQRGKGPFTTLGGHPKLNLNAGIDFGRELQSLPKEVRDAAETAGIKSDGDLRTTSQPFTDITDNPWDKALAKVKRDMIRGVSDIDGMPFYFKDLRTGTYVEFRGYLEGITESIAPEWSNQSYLGRSEPVWTYKQAERTIDFTLKVYAMSPKELEMIYKKINLLTGLCYPMYSQDQLIDNKSRMKPPLARMRLGDLYGKDGDGREQLGFLKNLTYNFDDTGTWESQKGAQVPKYILINISWQVIHDVVPSNTTEFFPLASKTVDTTGNHNFSDDKWSPYSPNSTTNKEPQT